MKFLIALSVLASAASATFTLSVPPAIGTNVMIQITAPCGGFTVTSESTFSEWRTGGQDVRLTDIVSTTGSSTFSFKAALLPPGGGNDALSFVELSPSSPTNVQGTLCYERIKGMTGAEWIGKEAVFQVEQYTGNGVSYYQCAAVRFVEGPQEVFDC